MLKKWCEVTSCNGIIDLYESKDNKKHFIFWTIVLVIMIMSSIFFTYRTIMGYVDCSTVTNVDTVTDAFLELPEVLIDYNGGLNVSAMSAEGFSDDFIYAFSASFNYNKKVVTANKSLQNELGSYLKKHNMGYVDMAQRFGYRCEDMVILFSEPDQSNQTCNTSQPFFTDHGVGYIFKSKSAQWYPGLWGGLSIMLKFPRNSFVQTYPSKYLPLALNDDFSITLEKSMGYFESGRSYLIPPNTNMEITLNTKLYKRINETRQCSGSKEMFTSNTCFHRCWLTELMKCANCVPIFGFGDGSLYNKSEVCNPLLFDPTCIDYERTKSCNQNCLPLCDEWLYEPTIAYSILAPMSLNDTISVVVVGYSTMQYTKIEEVKSFTIDMAISNVGGQAGLWLGASFVTLIQAFYYVIISICQRNDKTAVKPCSLNKL